MTHLQILKSIGFEVVTIEGLVAQLEAKATQANKKLLDRISSMEFYIVLVKGDQFTIYSEVGNHKYETDRISKFLGGKKFIQDNTVAGENGLYQEWKDGYTNGKKVISEVAEDLDEKIQANELTVILGSAEEIVAEATDYYNLNKSIIVKNEEPCEVIETHDKMIKFHKNGVVEITYEKDGLFKSYLTNKIKFRELDKRKDWKKAVLVFTKDSFQKEYSLQERSYYIYSDCKYFNANMGGSSLYGYCLDESDQGVRLDKYMYYENWKVEYCYIVEEKETSKC